MKNRFIFVTLTTLFFSISALADLKDDLYGENEAHKTYFDSFVMNCSQRTPQCVERENASENEEGFISRGMPGRITSGRAKAGRTGALTATP